MLCRRSTSIAAGDPKGFLGGGSLSIEDLWGLQHIIPEQFWFLRHGYLLVSWCDSAKWSTWRTPLGEDTFKNRPTLVVIWSVGCLLLTPHPHPSSNTNVSLSTTNPSSILLLNYRYSDQGGWEEEVITRRLWGWTWGVIKAKDLHCTLITTQQEINLRAAELPTEASGCWALWLVTSSCRTTCIDRNTALCWTTKPRRTQTWREGAPLFRWLGPETASKQLILDSLTINDVPVKYQWLTPKDVICGL